MAREQAKTDRLKGLISQLRSLTETGALHWERQLGSAHRYANWRGNLVILGPAESISNADVPRYLFITPLDSPACIEINSKDEELGNDVMKLVAAVEKATEQEPPTDPFAVNEEVLNRFTD